MHKSAKSSTGNVIPFFMQFAELSRPLPSRPSITGIPVGALSARRADGRRVGRMKGVGEK